MNLEFPNKIKIEEIDIEVNPYLTLTEIDYVIQQCLKHDDMVLREFAKAVSVFGLCCDMQLDYTTYDLLNANGYIQAVYDKIKNIKDVDDFIKRSESNEMMVKSFLDKIIVLVTKFEKKAPNKKALEKIIENLSIKGDKNDN